MIWHKSFGYLTGVGYISVNILWPLSNIWSFLEPPWKPLYTNGSGKCFSTTILTYVALLLVSISILKRICLYFSFLMTLNRVSSFLHFTMATMKIYNILKWQIAIGKQLNRKAVCLWHKDCIYILWCYMLDCIMNGDCGIGIFHMDNCLWIIHCKWIQCSCVL